MEQQFQKTELFTGIELTYLHFAEETFRLQHEPFEHVLLINYCRSGRMTWKMKNGNDSYLGSGDFSIHTMKTCADSIMTFPTGLYDGLLITIDLEKAEKKPPELLADADLFQNLLREKFCKEETFTSLTGNIQTESIFAGFYDQPEVLFPVYQKLKMLELLLYLARLERISGSCVTEYRSEQVKLIREIHDYLLAHMNQRITIKDLSKKYLMNPTTLKSTFKSVYGVSLATHIKEHRMTYAAKMLRESDLSIAEIAQNVGYDSQSRFSDAFKTFFHVLPTEYRKQQRF